jgi:hypothetical protein
LLVAISASVLPKNQRRGARGSKIQTAPRRIIITSMMIRAQILSYAAQQPDNSDYFANTVTTLESIIRDLNRLWNNSCREIIY